ncbi:unnamed protein product [Trichobilharzia szidati]|nr:unnamed protein product [Trichobilharzia szidati]
MVNLPRRHEEKLAIEKCLRSFIIKSIHAIVQARNGIVCNTNCMSEVGARNNMMVYVEEDPEIGATIKQTMDANFPVHVQDLLSLEIIAHWPREPQMLMVVEVWQFRLDIIERLESCNNNNNSTTIQNATTTTTNLNAAVNSNTTGTENCADGSQSTEYAVDDFRHLRLFEKLGTLLKSIMVVTRLLPGYRLSRTQDPADYQMCYTLRRGPSDLSRLGASPKSYNVGRVFSGLAVPQSPGEKGSPITTATATTVTDKTTKVGSDSGGGGGVGGLTIADGLIPVYLGTTVHYRTQIHYGPTNKLIPVVDGVTKANLSGKNGINEIFDANSLRSVDFHSLHNNQKSQKHVRVAEKPTQAVDFIKFEQSKLPCRVKPAFAYEQYETEPDEYFDPASQLLSKKSAERVARRFQHSGILETQEEHADSSSHDEDDCEEEGFDPYSSSAVNIDSSSNAAIHDGEVNHPGETMNNSNPRNSLNEIDLLELMRNLRSQCTSSPQEKDSASEDEDILSKQVPLQLPFSTFGVSGARLTHLFAELRERANLDLFQVPQINSSSNNNNSSSSLNPVSGVNNITGSAGGGCSNTAQSSSLFDADALADELERHERMLKEFDDFLSDFQNIEPFGIVRPPVPSEVVRQQHGLGSGGGGGCGGGNIPGNNATLVTTRTPHPVNEG